VVKANRQRQATKSKRRRNKQTALERLDKLRPRMRKTKLNIPAGVIDPRNVYVVP